MGGSGLEAAAAVRLKTLISKKLSYSRVHQGLKFTPINCSVAETLGSRKRLYTLVVQNSHVFIIMNNFSMMRQSMNNELDLF